MLPEILGHDQAVELKGFLLVPVFGGVWCQCANKTTARAGSRTVRINNSNLRAALYTGPSNGQAEYSRTPNCHISHCQNPSSISWSRKICSPYGLCGCNTSRPSLNGTKTACPFLHNLTTRISRSRTAWKKHGMCF